MVSAGTFKENIPTDLEHLKQLESVQFPSYLNDKYYPIYKLILNLDDSQMKDLKEFIKTCADLLQINNESTQLETNGSGQQAEFDAKKALEYDRLTRKCMGLIHRLKKSMGNRYYELCLFAMEDEIIKWDILVLRQHQKNPAGLTSNEIDEMADQWFEKVLLTRVYKIFNERRILDFKSPKSFDSYLKKHKKNFMLRARYETIGVDGLDEIEKLYR